MRADEKRLDQMDRLGDMGHFPVVVHAGATGNVLLTLVLTYLVEGWFTRHLLPFWLGTHGMYRGSQMGVLSAVLDGIQVWVLAAPFLWVALVLSVNLTPVVLLRLRLRETTPYPPLRRMSFWEDQHKFSNWVYLAASANMAFWVLLGWLAFAFSHTVGSLAAVLAVAGLATFSPVFVRRFQWW